MPKIQADSKTANLINSGVFLCLFLVSSHFAAVFSKPSATCASLLTSCSKRRTLGQYLNWALVPHDLEDILTLLLRVLFSSFMKEAIVAAMIPSMHKQVTNPQFGQKVQNQTLDTSWISGSAEGNDTKSPSHLFTIGKALIKTVKRICRVVHLIFVSILGSFQALCCLAIHTVSGMLFFGARSAVAGTFSLLLLVCQVFQIILRTAHFIYRNCFELGLSAFGHLAHDFSLLALEIVTVSSVGTSENLLAPKTSETKRPNVVDEAGDQKSLEELLKYNPSTDSE